LLYEIVLARSARREIARIPIQMARRIFARIERLAKDPRPSGTRKLHGSDDLFRIRIGDYRIIYRVLEDDAMVDVIAIRHRSDAYR
jgi:mRNA interferase RelE/StbE